MLSLLKAFQPKLQKVLYYKTTVKVSDDKLQEPTQAVGIIKLLKLGNSSEMLFV